MFQEEEIDLDDDDVDEPPAEADKKKWIDEWRAYKTKLNKGQGVTTDQAGKRHRTDVPSRFKKWAVTRTCGFAKLQEDFYVHSTCSVTEISS
jgi:hypothetical protein